VAVEAQDAEQFFQEKCAACHSIGAGRIVGPDLKGVLERQDRQWLVEFIMDPNAKLSGGDPYAQELLAAANNVPMPPLGVDELTANALLDYIAAKSGEVGVGPAPVEELESFTAEQREAGYEFFTGGRTLRKGAPACASCHTTVSLGGWGGGALGPDLTHAIDRLGGRRALTGWLGMPGSATMLPIFGEKKLTPEEIDALVAFLEQEAASELDAAPSVTASFLGAGVLGAIVLLLLGGFFWKGRYTATRIPMVEKSKR
jgi:mono/diheme cytochrome c family protein